MVVDRAIGAWLRDNEGERHRANETHGGDTDQGIGDRGPTAAAGQGEMTEVRVISWAEVDIEFIEDLVHQPCEILGPPGGDHERAIAAEHFRGGTELENRCGGSERHLTSHLVELGDQVLVQGGRVAHRHVQAFVRLPAHPIDLGPRVVPEYGHGLSIRKEAEEDTHVSRGLTGRPAG